MHPLDRADRFHRTGHFYAVADAFRARSSNFVAPTFRFQPLAFVPPDTKARVVLKLCDLAPDDDHVPANQIQHPKLPANTQLGHIFFKSGPAADVVRTRLVRESHFVNFNNQLKSIRIPSLTFNIAAQEISFDWRQVCDSFLQDELQCRVAANSLGPWFSSSRRDKQ